MRWLFERHQYTSDISGTIDVQRIFGRWEASVGGNSQAGAYLTDLWRNAFYRHLPKDIRVKKILMIGLGIGSTLPLIHRRFRDCHVTAIEIDSKMVELMDTLNQPAKQGIRPEVLIGDALEVMRGLSGSFDLILSDPFEGKEVASVTRTTEYAEQLARLVDPHGWILANGFTQANAFEAFDRTLIRQMSWKFHLSYVSLYRPHGAGVFGDQIPEGYHPYFSCEPYLRREATTRPFLSVKRSGVVAGIRASLRLFAIEQYFGDVEPELVADDLPRWVFWHPIARLDKPKGWIRFPIHNHRRKTGFTLLDPHEEYWRRWSSQARRHRQAWLKQNEWELFTPTVEEYCEAYARSGKRGGIISLFSDGVRKKSQAHGELMQLFGVRRVSDGRMVAGFAGLDVPEIEQSIHVTSFICPEARSSPAGTALVDRWFQHCQARKIRFLEFDGFYSPGDPMSWQGFSQFKAQFGVYFLMYPYPLMKWVGKRKLSTPSTR